MFSNEQRLLHYDCYFEVSWSLAYAKCGMHAGCLKVESMRLLLLALQLFSKANEKKKRKH